MVNQETIASAARRREFKSGLIGRPEWIQNGHVMLLVGGAVASTFPEEARNAEKFFSMLNELVDVEEVASERVAHTDGKKGVMCKECSGSGRDGDCHCPRCGGNCCEGCDGEGYVGRTEDTEGKRAYRFGNTGRACVSDRNGQLLDGLTVKYSKDERCFVGMNADGKPVAFVMELAF